MVTGGIRINDANVIAWDIAASNGIIHVIDSVLLPPAPTTTTTTTVVPSIVEIALSDDNFSTLVAAIQAADLLVTLQGAGPFTVFAPTNDAFNKLPSGTLESLLMPENKEQLKQILMYHVVWSNVKSTDLWDNLSANTVQG